MPASALIEAGLAVEKDAMAREEQTCARVNEPAPEQLQVEVEKLHCRLREAEAEVQRTRERLRRQGQLVITWRRQLTDQEKVIGQLRSERDVQMREIAASVMFVEAELRREQAQILALLADKDQTIAHQERQIHALLVFNRKLAAAVPEPRHKQTRRHSCPSKGKTTTNGFNLTSEKAYSCSPANLRNLGKRSSSDCSSLVGNRKGGISRSPVDCCHDNHARFRRDLDDVVVVASDNHRVGTGCGRHDLALNNFPDLINGQANKENVVPGFGMMNGGCGCEGETRGFADVYHPNNGVNGHHGSVSCACCCCCCSENREDESSADEEKEEVDDYLGQLNHASSINGIASSAETPWEHLRAVEDSVRNYDSESNDDVVVVPYVPYPHSNLSRHLPTLEALDEAEEYDDECLNGSSSPEESRINHRALLHGSFEQLAIVHDRGKHLSACYNRVMSNHRNVTKPKDVKYKKINRVKSRSLEELRGKLRNWTHPFFVSEKST